MLASKFSHNVHHFLSREPLTDDQIARVAPSVFADEAHHSRSERYTQIPTIDVLNGLRREGFQPFMVAQQRTRKADKRGFAKHMLRLRHDSVKANGEANEIILLNSHDGTSSYQMLAGCFRFVCANGLVLGDTTADIRVRHKGDIVHNVIEGAYTVLDEFQSIDMHKDAMRSIELPPVVQHGFAQAALEWRYGGETVNEEGESVPNHIPVQPQQILQPRRVDDRKNDLWTAFNRIQENMTKGGLQGRNTKGRRQRTRAVSGIDSDVKLNRALWTLAETIKEAMA